MLDAFVGSGTTVAVAERLLRRWVGLDSSKFAVYTTQARLLRQVDRCDTSGTGFVHAAGLYDYNLLRELPWDEYRTFVLQLFQCRVERATLRGVSFDGLLGDHRVLVYDFRAHEAARIGESFVEDLATLCGPALGDRCFIIAPLSLSSRTRTT